MSDNVYVEIVPEETGCIGDSPAEMDGNICVTMLRNYAMPLIRYKLEDKGVLKKIFSVTVDKEGTS